MNIKDGDFYMSNKKRKRSKHIGKIGWCDKQTLGLSKGHYVFIRRVNNGKCDVNTFTSLVRDNGNLKIDKINHVKFGNIYPIPLKDISLTKFSGVDRRVIRNIPLNKIEDIDRYKLNRRHHNYIQKYVK